jgi:hypothetical protein
MGARISNGSLTFSADYPKKNFRPPIEVHLS